MQAAGHSAPAARDRSGGARPQRRQAATHLHKVAACLGRLLGPQLDVQVAQRGAQHHLQRRRAREQGAALSGRSGDGQVTAARRERQGRLRVRPPTTTASSDQHAPCPRWAARASRPGGQGRAKAAFARGGRRAAALAAAGEAAAGSSKRLRRCRRHATSALARCPARLAHRGAAPDCERPGRGAGSACGAPATALLLPSCAGGSGERGRQTGQGGRPPPAH